VSLLPLLETTDHISSIHNLLLTSNSSSYTDTTLYCLTCVWRDCPALLIEICMGRAAQRPGLENFL